MSTDKIFSFLGQVIIFGGGSVGVAYLVFTYLGKKWIDNKFEKRLTKFDHELNLQIEQYKFEINSLFNRISKIHEKEFEVLPTMWLKLVEAMGKVSQLTDPSQQYPELNKMSKAEIEELLSEINLYDSQKDKIRNAKDKTKNYTKSIFLLNLVEANTFVYDFHNYLIFNKIFLSHDLFEKFSQIDLLLRNSLMELEIPEGTEDDIRLLETFSKITDGSKELIKEIEYQIQKRLHYSDTD